MIGHDEIRAFAQTIATATARTLSDHESSAWEPGRPQDDRNPALGKALEQAGWLSLADDLGLLAFCGPAGVELGRRLAPVCELDALLGASLMAGELVRHGAAGDRAVRVEPGALSYVRIDAAVPCPYGDAFGVHRVLAMAEEERVAIDAAAARARVAAWIAAGVGYCTGLAEYAFELSLDYARSRRAFGTTLAGLSAVQQMLAEAATTVRGLSLLAWSEPGADALAYAGWAVCEVTATCQQVTGAIGFTLEFQLQRAYRRARALRLWNDAVLDGLALTAPEPASVASRPVGRASRGSS